MEIGGGDGDFTRALVDMTRGRNPLLSVTATGQAAPPAGRRDRRRSTACRGRSPVGDFNISWRRMSLDRDTVAYLLEHAFALLEDGGRAVFMEANPWNPMSALRVLRERSPRPPLSPTLLSRTQLYELLSEIGFIRVSARFTDFVYRPLVPDRHGWPG